MSTRLGDLVKSLGGELIGDPEVIVTGIAPLEAAGEAHITFLSNTKLRSQAAATRAAALIAASSEVEALQASFHGAFIVTDACGTVFCFPKRRSYYARYSCDGDGQRIRTDRCYRLYRSSCND
ncbi:MAG: UDP-3-O-(3-hydroxymyristoyl)-glucosamine N-acyltransferase [Pseudomonadota bacterium]